MTDNSGRISFEPIETKDEAYKVLNEAARARSFTQLFSQLKRRVLTCHFSHIRPEENQVGFKPERPNDIGPFLIEIKESKSPFVFVNIANEKNKVFFKSQIISYKDNMLVMNYPQGVFRVQRRQHLRYKIPQGHTMRLDVESATVPGGMFSKKIIDISAGGVAFYIEAPEAEHFPSGKTIQKIRFQVDRSTILCSAQIRHVRPARQEGSDKMIVGVLFTAMPIEDQVRIESFIREKMKALLSRML